jgi:hypothetical protein
MQVVTHIAANLGLSGYALDALFTLDLIDAISLTSSQPANKTKRCAVQVVADVAANLGLSGDALDSLFTLELADANAPEPFPTPISYRAALAHYMDLDATPSPTALAAFAECIEEGDPDASDKLHRLAGALMALPCC